MTVDTVQKILIGVLGATVGFFLNRWFQLNRERRRTILPLADSLRKAIVSLEKDIQDDQLYSYEATTFAKVLQEASLRTEHEQLPSTIKDFIDSSVAALTTLAAISHMIRLALCKSYKYNQHVVANGPFSELSAEVGPGIRTAV